MIRIPSPKMERGKLIKINDDLQPEYDLHSLRLRKVGPRRKNFGEKVSTIKYQIFISSTYEDLKQERDEVIKACLLYTSRPNNRLTDKESLETPPARFRWRRFAASLPKAGWPTPNARAVRRAPALARTAAAPSPNPDSRPSVPRRANSVPVRIAPSRRRCKTGCGLSLIHI